MLLSAALILKKPKQFDKMEVVDVYERQKYRQRYLKI